MLQQRQPQFTPNRFFDPNSDFAPQASTPAQPAPQPGDIAKATDPSAPPQSPAQQFFSGPNPAPPAAPPSPVPSYDQWHQQHGDAPIAGPPQVPHHGKIASIMMGIGEALGNPLATRLGQRDRELQQNYNDYERELPATQYKANRADYEQEIGNEQKGSEIGRATAETKLAETQNKNLQMVGPPGKTAFLKEFTDQLKSGQRDPQKLYQEYLSRGAAFGVSRQELTALANNTPEAPPQAKIGQQGIAEPVMWHDRMWNGTEPDAPDVVKNAFATAKPVETTIHENKLQEQRAASQKIILQSNLQNGGLAGKLDIPQGATGEAALAKLDEGTAAMIRMVGDGKVDFGTVTSRMTPAAKQNFSEGVHAYNPNFDQATFSVRKGVQEDLTSGGKSNTILAYNTSLKHLDSFLKIASKLNNGDFTPLNELGQAIGQKFGSNASTNFALARDFFSGEVGKAAAGTNATVGERQEIADKISRASSWDQLQGAAQTAKEFLEGKRGAMQHQSEMGLQGKADFGEAATSEHTAPAAKIMSHAQVQQAAKDHGISEQEATRQAKAAGYTVQ